MFLIRATSRAAHCHLTLRMDHHVLICLLAVVTASTDQNNMREDKLELCKDVLSSFVPVVKPYKADHLQITWYDLLDKCRGLVENVTIFFDDNEHYEKFLKGSLFMHTDPCKFHKIKMNFYLEVRSLPSSKFNFYCDSDVKTRKGREDLYGGLIKETIEGVCMEKNGTFMIPETPAAIAACIL